jgi:peroxiredoxin
MPGLDRLSRKLDPKRFAVVGLSVDKDTLLAAEFLVQHGISFANIFDQSGKMTRSLGVNVYPETFVIAPDRRILLRVSGQREWDSPEMISMLEEIQKL